MTHRVGIIGGGQLGALLCEAARKLGMHTTVLTGSSGDPACTVCDRALVAGSEDLESLEEMISGVDVVTFEKEAISAEFLERLTGAANSGDVRVFPRPDTMLLLQNKGRQKQWLAEQGFPTSPFKLLEGSSATADDLIGTFGLPLVQKALQGGYDGLGVQILRDRAQCEGLWTIPSLVEGYVERESELAILVARTEDGALMTYPPVGLKVEEQQHVMLVAASPAPVSAEITREALDLGERIVTGLDGVGVFAIEMFLTPAGELLVNEISPRVHNSGHHTLESCETSQFEQHLRAICGLPLGAADQQQAAATRNLLCTPEIEVLCRTGVSAYKTSFPETHLHWYGKSEARPGRKLGHVTALGPDTETAAERSRLEIEHLVRYAGELS